MTLRELAESVANDALLLQDGTRMRNEAAEFGQLFEELSELKVSLGLTMSFANVLAAAAIPGKTRAIPSNVVTDLTELAPNGQFVETPLAKARKPLEQLDRWARESNSDLKARWEKWCDNTLPDLNAAESFAAQLGKVDAIAAARIRLSLRDAKVARLRLPGSTEDVDRVRTLAEDLHSATTDFAPTQTTQDFLDAILGRGAPIDLLTDEIAAWAHEKGFWSALRVRLGDADE